MGDMSWFQGLLEHHHRLFFFVEHAWEEALVALVFLIAWGALALAMEWDYLALG